MKTRLVLFAARTSADPLRRRMVILGLFVLSLIVGVAGVAEAGPIGGIGPFPGR